MRFINFKLYKDLGMNYPPVMNEEYVSVKNIQQIQKDASKSFDK